MATPTVRLRRLASELRRLRRSSGLTQEQVTRETGVSAPSLFRVENARAKPQARTLTALLNLYGVDGAEREALLELHKNADQRGMYGTYRDGLRGEYPAYISFESEAAGVSTYQLQAIPGLLQTADYARAIIKGTIPYLDDAELQQRAQARMERQQLLRKATPLQLHAIIDETALRRMIGGKAVMDAQIQQLIHDAERSNVTIQLMTFEHGAHESIPGSFVLLDFADPDPPLVYLEHMGGDVFLDGDVEVARFVDIFTHLKALAYDPSESVHLLQSIAKGIK